MTVTLPDVVEVDQAARMPGGLLRAALPAPEGWERGLSFEFYQCGEPAMLEPCVIAADEPHRPGEGVTFHPVPFRQGATCSTLSKENLSKQAADRSESTIEWVMGRQLALDPLGLSDVSLADADVLGTVAGADFVSAVGCLEQAAADTGFGARWMLHGPIRAASYLADHRLLQDGLSPNGAPWIFSPGYPVEASTTIRLWATGLVYASTSPARPDDVVDWRRNSALAYAQREGIVAFNPCINIAVDVTVPACP